MFCYNPIMADQELRELERAVSTGDPEAFARLIQYVVRMTGLTENQAAARYHFPNLYQWCLAAIAHETVYYIQEWFPQTNYQPVRAYLKYYTIKEDDRGKAQLSQCWLNADRYSPHYDKLVAGLRWIDIDRHPWGQRFCFLGSGYADKLEDIFRLFGLHSRRGSVPHLQRLFSVHPNTYQDQFEEDENLGYIDDEDEDDEDEDEDEEYDSDDD